MRELTSHKVNGCNDKLTVSAIDEPGSGGANHAYVISGFNSATNQSNPPNGNSTATLILFQNGPIKETDINGVTHENLLAILIDRFQGFQSGKFACSENATALNHLESALQILKQRTEQRLRRGVEGTHKV